MRNINAHKIHLFLFPLLCGLILGVIHVNKQVNAGVEGQWPNTVSPVAQQVWQNATDTRGTKTSDGYYILAMSGLSTAGVQKLDTSSNKLWNSGNPVTISNSTYVLEVVADNNGGAFILHNGLTVNNQDMYVSHVTSSGTVNWTAGPFNDVATDDFWPRILHDGNGGVYVSWSANSTNYAVYVTYLNSNGSVQSTWNTAGSGTYRKVTMPVTTGSNKRPEPRMVLSDSGSVIVSYMTTTGIITAKLTTAGAFAWSSIPTYSTYHKITDSAPYLMMSEADGGNGVFISYVTNNATSTHDLKLARIDSAGAFQLGNATSGVTKKQVPYNNNGIYGMGSATDNIGNYYLTWGQTVGTETDSYVQKFNSLGMEQWTTGGVLMGTLNDGVENFVEWLYTTNIPHVIVYDGLGGAIVAMNRQSGTIASAVVAQRVNSAGNLYWGSDGYMLTGDPLNDYDYKQAVISDGNGGAIIHWYQWDDSVASDYISAQYVTSIVEAPSITNVSPSQIHIDGGTELTITGSDFTGATKVTVDDPLTGAECLINTVTDIEITCTAPAHTAGTVNVYVTTPVGDSGTSGNGLLTYAQLVPDAESATIELYMGDNPPNVPSWTWISAGISNGDDLAGLSDLDYPGTPIENPNSDPITVSGGIKYSFALSGEPYVTTPSPSSIISTAGATPIDVTNHEYSDVIDIGFNAKIYGKTVRYLRINRVGFIVFSPDNTIDNDCNNFSCWNGDGPNGGVSMSDYGSLPPGVDGSSTTDIMVAAKWADYGGTDGTISYKREYESTYARFIITYDAVTHWGDGTETFQMVLTAPPSIEPFITDISDDYDGPDGGKTVTLTGVNFVSPSTVSFGSEACTNVNVISSTTLTCTTPANAPGYVDVTVSTVNGVSSPYSFFYYGPPSITSIFPERGPIAGGFNATINGSGFGSETTVIFGTSSATINSYTQSQLMITVPSSASTGEVTVYVTNPVNQTATSTFTYELDSAHILTEGTAHATEPQIILASDGNYIIAWKDMRDGNRNIYMQKVDSNGNSYWTTYGKLLSNQPGDQPRFSDIIMEPDLSGGAFLAWSALSNGTSGNDDIFVTHIDSNGVWDWGTTYAGINISSANIRGDASPFLLPDGSGGVYVAWREANASWVYSAKLTHLDSSGSVTSGWPQTVSLAGTINNVKLLDTADGNVFMAMHSSNLLYVRKFDSGGNLISPFNSNFIISGYGTGSGYAPSQDGWGISSDGGEGIITGYSGYHSTGNELRASYVDAAGNYKWGTFTGSSYTPYLVDTGFDTTGIQILGDGEGGIILLNRDNVNPRIYAHKVVNGTSDAEKPWGSRITISAPGSFGHNPYQQIKSDGYGGALIAYRAYPDDFLIATQIRSDGSIGPTNYYYPKSGWKVSSAAIAGEGIGGITWHDLNPVTYEPTSVYFGIIEATASPGGSGPGGSEGISTTLNIDNSAPSFTVNPSDNGSDGSTPTNVGSDVTFTATATDINKDGYYLAICKTNAVTPGASGAAPSCTGGAWAVSATPVTSGSQATVTYTALVTDAESNDWYAFVCDDNSAETACSSAGTSDMPFKVNHTGTFGTVTVTNTNDQSTIVPGNTLRFTLPASQIADSDTDTAQDLMTMYICTAATTSFDYAANSCTGGAVICSSSAVNPTNTAAVCDGGASLISVPTAHGSYDFKVYVKDHHDFPAAGTNTQSYSVADVPPVLSGYVTTDPVSLSAGSSDTVTRGVTFTDDNGDHDPISLSLVFFDDDVTNDICTANEKSCYRVDGINPSSLPANCTHGGTLSTPGTGKTATGTDSSLTITCDLTVWFNANASQNWEVSATVTDGLGPVNFADSNVNTVIGPLSALGVNETVIGYGLVSIGGDSAHQTTTIQNMGNQILDVLVNGTDMSSGSNTIIAAQQKWQPVNADFSWEGGGGFSLVTSATSGEGAAQGCLNRDIAVRSVHDSGTASDEAVAWKIRIPSTQPSGSYSGQNTFSTTPYTGTGSCTGTLY